MDMTSVTSEQKRQKLRQSLVAPEPLVAVGAHDAMSAQLIEQHGFDAVWVSGFGISTMAYAVPDLNLVTQTETLEGSVRIDRAVTVPVIADCDNGFGALGNVVRTVQLFEAAGIAGVCIEDNTFPKRNSLFQGDALRELVPVEEQARRIAAAKMSQVSSSFVVIARVEALIAGHGVAAACERADAYAEAGADAILIHSKDRSLREIEEFLATWSGVGIVPLVAVPTLFPDFTVDELYDKGFQMVILANHPMRAAVRAMETALKALAVARKPAVLDGDIATVDHVFELVGTKSAIELEETWQPQPAAVVLEIPDQATA